jgi:hypothetical protein
MPTLVGFVTVYKCLILFSVQYGSFACIKCRRAQSRFEPEPKQRLHSMFLVIFATLCTQMSGRCLYLATTGSSQISSNPSFNIISIFDTLTLILSYCQRRHIQHKAQETAICRNPHNSSNWDSHITRQLGYKTYFLSKYCVHKKMLIHKFS